MRFPWLQVDADFIAAHAGDLGAMLGVSRREAMGMALDLWTWALARAPDDAPPDGLVTGTGPVPDRLLSGSVGWTGPVEQFSDALVACGLAERVDGGYRLTGFSRYRATWEKNRRRTGGKPERNRTGAGAEPDRKTQTKTQKEETTLSADADPAGVSAAGLQQAALLDTPEVPRGPKPEDLQALWNRLAPPKGLQRWEAMGDDRRRLAKAALSACPDLAKWEAWLAYELSRPFNLGGDTGAWQANVDWLLRVKTRNQVRDFDPKVAASIGRDRPRLDPPSNPQPAVRSDKPRL